MDIHGSIVPPEADRTEKMPVQGRSHKFWMLNSEFLSKVALSLPNAWIQTTDS